MKLLAVTPRVHQFDLGRVRHRSWACTTNVVEGIFCGKAPVDQRTRRNRARPSLARPAVDHYGLVIVQAFAQHLEQLAKILWLDRVEVVDGEEVCIDTSLGQRCRATRHRLTALNISQLAAGLQAKDGADPEVSDRVEVLFDCAIPGARPGGERQVPRGLEYVGREPREIHELHARACSRPNR